MSAQDRRFQTIDGVLGVIAALVTAAAVGAILALRASAAPFLPPLERLDEPLPASALLLLSNASIALAIVAGAGSLTAGLGVRLLRHKLLGRVFLGLASVVPFALFAFTAHGHATLETMSTAVRGSVAGRPCPCPEATAFVGERDAQCACDPAGRVVEVVADGDGDHVFDVRVLFERDAAGAVVAESIDLGRDGSIDRRCRFEPPCADPDWRCMPDCR